MNKEKIELIANISLVLIGLIVGTVYLLDCNHEISMIYFSIALTSILYQFLGGTESDSSFNIDALKFGGSTAVLMGFIFLFSTYVPLDKSCDKESKLISTDNWIPISIENGQVIKVDIPYKDTTKSFPVEGYKKKRKNHEYLLYKNENNKYNIALKISPNESIGYVEVDNIEGVFKNVVDNTDEKAIQVFTLYPDDENMDSTEDLDNVKLPFEIEVFNKSRFKIVEKSKKFNINPNYNDQEIVIKTSYVVNYPDCFYIVFLEQANSKGSLLNKRYSKWLVKKFNKV